MVIEHRSYTVLPDKMTAWLVLWKASALPVEIDHLGGFLGMYLTEIGPLNEVLHLWQFVDLADRERRRAALEADPRWATYRAAIDELAPITVMHSRILRPASFSPRLTAVA